MTWIQTRSGNQFDFLSPHPSSVSIRDIASSLARIPRWAGHTNYDYSVGEHSLWVCDCVEQLGGSPMDCLLGLLHDAPEAYTGDIARPLKNLLGDTFKQIERGIWDAISTRVFGRVVEIPSIVKQADDTALVTEARDLFTFAPINRWVSRYDVRPASQVIRPSLCDDHVIDDFLDAYYYLTETCKLVVN